jgi:2-succinyl-6-hydroxy-2,4-cyclohexadiene-1-carboxylate synthase
LRGRVTRRITIGASPGLADPTERAARRAADERLAARIETLSIEAFAREWAATPILAGVPQRVAGAAYEDRLRSTPLGLARALRGLGTGSLPPVWDRLEELEAPVTLIAGERDEKFRQIATRMAASIRGARVEIVPGAGHAVHLERPAAVAGILLQPE